MKGMGWFFICQILNDLREAMLKMGKENLEVTIEWVWILFCYILFPDRKCRSDLAEFHLPLRGQPLYDRPSSPCKSFRLNGEYRYLQLLLSRDTYRGRIFTYFCREIKLEGGNPLTH